MAIGAVASEGWGWGGSCVLGCETGDGWHPIFNSPNSLPGVLDEISSAVKGSLAPKSVVRAHFSQKSNKTSGFSMVFLHF